ncbi:MAG: hypothetical protein JWM56_958 [Candidatus Peribacteria bacterium]|nr:hypothetical protein [Candidatus Peribacteria bacterium]
MRAIFSRAGHWLPLVVLAAAGLACTAFLFHGLQVNRQPDPQLLNFAFGFLDAVRQHHLADFLLTVRKYPLLPSLVLAGSSLCVLGGMFVTGMLHSMHDAYVLVVMGSAAVHFVSRLWIVASAVATLVTLDLVAARLFPAIRRGVVVPILLSSTIFLLLATAIRPHMVVTCFTVLSFYYSLRLAESKTPWHMMAAFGTALVAFCSLQNGLFAFLFPVWGFLMVGGRPEMRRLLHRQLWLALAICGVLAVLLGYPFLVNLLLGRPVHLTFDLGHDYIATEPKWTGGGFLYLLMLLRGTEMAMAILAAWTCVRQRQLIRTHPGLLIILVYVALYVLCFGLYAGSSMRFFLPILPFLALLAVPSFALLPSVIKHIFWCLVILLHVKLGVLALLPDTYDIARLFVLQQTSGTIASDFPFYYLDIPPTRSSIATPGMEKERYIRSLSADLPHARPYVPLPEWQRADVLVLRTRENQTFTGFSPCYGVASLPWSYDVFLWGEVDWSVFGIVQTKRLGPPLTVYCRQK